MIVALVGRQLIAQVEPAQPPGGFENWGGGLVMLLVAVGVLIVIGMWWLRRG